MTSKCHSKVKPFIFRRLKQEKVLKKKPIDPRDLTGIFKTWTEQLKTFLWLTLKLFPTWLIRYTKKLPYFCCCRFDSFNDDSWVCLDQIETGTIFIVSFRLRTRWWIGETKDSFYVSNSLNSDAYILSQSLKELVHISSLL